MGHSMSGRWNRPGRMTKMQSLTYQAPDRGHVVDAIERLTGCSTRRAAALVATAARLSDLRAYTAAELQRHLTPVQAARLLSAWRLDRALASAECCRDRVNRPNHVADFLRAAIGDARQECFLVVGLDARQGVVQAWTAGVGSLSQVDVHPREVFRPVIVAGCHSVIIGHNHPSGDAEPSEADITLTTRMAEVGRLVGIPVLDHIVVTGMEHSSLAAMGLMPAAS